jgi:RNA polymerase sigma-70 factor (ECF subfamily)
MLISAQPPVGNWELSLSGQRQSEASAVRDDHQLVRAAADGDAAAFSSLVRKYQQRLCTALLHICGSMDEAEDVAQEAFVQAYLKLATFAGESAFYTWLYRIAINNAISRRRRRREETSVEHTRDRLGVEPQDAGEQAEERLLREERAIQVQQALARLSAEHRAILVLREVDGCDYDAIAQILDLPVGTVRSRLHRARLQLRDQLDLLLQEPGGRG